MITIGNFRGDVSGAITTDTPPYEWDDTSTADTIYLRYENTTGTQFLVRITTKWEACYDTWANRTTTSNWRAVNYAG